MQYMVFIYQVWSSFAHTHILNTCVRPSLWQQLGDVGLLSQHEELFPQFGVKGLDWPAQSPDVNPIQHLPGEPGLVSPIVVDLMNVILAERKRAGSTSGGKA